MAVLAGVRVLDFGRYVAGPYCATLLGYLGAEVIRIEKRDGGEDRYIAPIAASGEGGVFFQTACNKKSLTLDPASAQGREIVQRLVRTADVVVANLTRSGLEVTRARLREPQGNSCRHHPRDADFVRRRRSARGKWRLRWRRAGNVRGDVHDRHTWQSGQVRCALRRLFDGRAVRVRHAGGADASRADRRRPGSEGPACSARRWPCSARTSPNRARSESTACRLEIECRRPPLRTCSRLATGTC